MKYCRFLHDHAAHYGLVECVAGREEITRVFSTAPEHADLLEDIPTKRIAHVLLSEATLLAPVAPSKIVCVGRNYRAHAAELGNEAPTEPLIFLKPPSSLLDPGGVIVRPRASERVDFEGELGVVIGKRCLRRAPDFDVLSCVLGYTVVNDVTARDLQKKDAQWTRGKGFDTFCPVGPVVVSRDEVDPSLGVSIETRVNSQIRQSGNTRDFIFSLDVVLRYITDFMTLMPGDLIATGTPEGVGPLVDGDVVEVSVEGIGTLRNSVRDQESAN
jgi:2-keto-4-pentenoate hydratase/2-oxohepta-3-ene-1,7-dioic acid hydratase in catechol pathway